jgi:hypothetical protein
VGCYKVPRKQRTRSACDNESKSVVDELEEIGGEGELKGRPAANAEDIKALEFALSLRLALLSDSRQIPSRSLHTRLFVVYQLAAYIMSNHSTNLPQVTRGVVYTAQASITINASVDRVWDVLLDFSRYTEW